MLAVGDCWANAHPGCNATADKPMIIRHLEIATNTSPQTLIYTTLSALAQACSRLAARQS
ncbi:MAG: hypothetical protein ACJ8E4_02525 [Sphingomicrobium sp.]